jgi:4-oxalocrotonate tautomerase
MPYVNVKITRGGVTKAQKRRIVEDITASLVTTLGKQPEHIHVVIDEIAPENWGFAGMLTTEYRAQTQRPGAPRAGRNRPSPRTRALGPARS